MCWCGLELETRPAETSGVGRRRSGIKGDPLPLCRSAGLPVCRSGRHAHSAIRLQSNYRGDHAHVNRKLT